MVTIQEQLSDVELRQIKEAEDLNESLQKRFNASQSEIDEARFLVARKVAGQRRQAGSTPTVERLFTFLITRPETIRRVSQTTELQAEAERLGFDSLQEFVGAQQQFSPRGVQAQVEPRSDFEIASSFPVAPGFGEQTRFPSGPVDVPSEIGGFAGQIFRGFDTGGQTIQGSLFQEDVLPPSTVEVVEERTGFIPRLEAFTLEKETKGLRGQITPLERVGLFGTSLILPIAQFPARTFEFGRAVVSDPFGTVASIPSGLFASARGLGRELRSPTPETALGGIGSEILIFKGLGKIPQATLKVSDIARTTGLRQLPTADIIAPEFLFKGQTFPAIRKGQTAGQLLAEFKPILPGEILPGGFTASPIPFAKITQTGRGTSELPGVFQSPLVSPRFLRISGEADRKLFSLNLFDTFRPSIVRITPERIRLGPGVLSTQKQLAQNLKETRKFFEQKAPKGESIIPFLKTEKEAIIPFGTELALIDKRFFVKFEGRRVPIFEFETRGVGKGRGKGLVEDIGKLPSVEDITRSLSRGVTRERGLITPLSSTAFVPSRSSLSASIGRGLPSSAFRSSGVSRISPRDPFSIGDISRVGGRGVSSFRPLPPTSAPRIILPSIDDFLDPIGKPRVRRGERKKKKKDKKKKGKKRTTPTRVSFTGIVLGIEKGAFVSPRFGVSPFQIRGLRTGRGKRSRNRFLTDL